MQMSHVHILTTSSSLSAQSNESNPVMINAHIGTHVTQRHVSLLTYRLGPMFLFEEHLSSGTIHTIYKLGPSYFGSFQAPILQDAVSEMIDIISFQGVGIEEFHCIWRCPLFRGLE